MDDVFISYGRAESKAFATKLNDRLIEKGYKIWFDQDDIPLGVDFQNQINMGIELAHNFIFIIAPHSLKSEYCLKEVELAVKRNKRIIPILHIEPKEKKVWEKMHPTVSKLNWIYMRQEEDNKKPIEVWKDIDDFEKSFEGLVQLIESHKNYVNKHTNLLGKALEWDKHNREEKFLLTGVERKEAEEWLATDFSNEQPPVAPTGLHAEYICESKEAANNHLTDVFFCYEDNDHEYAERFHLSLNRKGFTTWTKKTDLQAGQRYDEAVKKGIENNSNFVFLISNTSISSKTCLQELTHALSLNKRIIPLMIDDIDNQNLPEAISDVYKINYIDKYEENYQSAIRNLIAVLKKDFEYYQIHRGLTVRAIEWQFRNKLQTLLLHGFDLEKALDWLKKNKDRDINPPTALIVEFIDESTKSRPTVFISYGRKHSLHFAAWLNEQLAAKGFDVWFDKEDIPLGVDFQEQIDDGIEKADNFLFIISPHSVKSQYCLKEVELAVKLKKQIIPILHIEPKDCWDKMHPVVEKLNWVYFKEEIDENDNFLTPFDELTPGFENAFDGLYELMTRHTAYVRQHTSILVHALDWIRNEKDDRLLLSGSERKDAEEWLETVFEDEQPPCEPTDLHAEYICESKEYANGHLTDVFLCYDETETEVPIRFHYALMQNAITTWSKETDVKPGDIYEQAAAEGIEKNTNFMYFVSNKTLASDSCNAELNYAIKLNKRIIPVLLDKVNKENLPVKVRTMFMLNLADKNEDTFERTLSQFKNLIGKNSDYYEEHRDILVKAIKWFNSGKKQKNLLFGFDLENANQWLELSEEMREKPTTLQRQFIKESSVSRIKIFISYGRAHSLDFAQKLYNKLASDGFDVWFDKNDIPLGVDFQNQIDEGIEKADNFVFIISPHSVKSKYCLKEIELAIKLHKRIIPLLHVEPTDCWEQMHPVIEKLNWIYFKEKENNFDTSYKGLIDLLNQHSSYVAKHTLFLNKALRWERNSRNEAYLLTGSNRHDAEKWLVTKFTEQQPPATPTELHADFICESKKAANNMMTDIFFSYARPDAETLATIRKSLSKRGYTTWIDTSDIKSGSIFAEAINAGIEQADNFVLLISPEAMASKYCLLEIEHVLKLNKRIIPILIRKTDLELIPPEISSIQFIDLTDNFDNIESTKRGEKSDYDKDLDQLIVEIENDHEYHYLNKVYTVNAIKWEKQQKNPSILLSGYELENAEAWIKVGKQRNLNQPIELVEKFIKIGRSKAGELSPEVLICYDDEDFDFAMRLNMQLKSQGKITWFDLEYLPADANPVDELIGGIDNSDNIVFLVSPKAATSKRIKKAAKYANENNKRIITLICQEVPLHDLPDELSAINPINFKPKERDFHDAFSDLLRALDIDREYIQNHTRFLQRAAKWENNKREKELLLKGSDFAIAEAWLVEAQEQKKKPEPTSLQIELIKSSKEDIERIEREKKEYTERLKRALEEAKRAKAVAEVESSKSKALYISTLVPRNASQNPTKAVRIAHEAFKIAHPDTPVSVLRSFNDAFYYPDNHKMLFYNEVISHGNQIVHKTMFSPDNKLVLSIANQAVIRNNRLEEIACCHLPDDSINCAAFSPDNKLIAFASEKGVVYITDTNGNQKAIYNAHKAAIKHITFSPDSKLIATASEDKLAKLWTTKGKLHAELKKHTEDVNKIVFSPNGKLIATAGGEDISPLPGTFIRGEAIIWSTEGKCLAEMYKHAWGVTDITFNSESDMLATASNDGNAILWDTGGNEIASLIGHKRGVRSVEFSADNSQVLTSSADGSLRLWNLKGDELECFEAHSRWITTAKFVCNSTAILSASFDGTIQLRQTNGNLIAVCKGHDSSITSADISADGNEIISSSWDKTIRSWRVNHSIPVKIPYSDKFVLHSSGRKMLAVSENIAKEIETDGTILKTFEINKDEVVFAAYKGDKEVVATTANKKIVVWNTDGKVISKGKIKYADVLKFVLSPNNDYLCGICTDNTVKIWDFTGNEIATAQGHTAEITAIDIAPNGKTILTASADNTIRIWNKNGKQEKLLKGHTHRINSAVFSPNGKHILTASTDTTARLWDLKGKQLATFDAHLPGVLHAAFSPSGDRIVTSAQDNTAILWNLEGSKLAQFEGHKNFVNYACFSPDNKMILTTSWDNTAKLWTIDGNEVASFNGHDNIVESAVFLPDSQHIVTVSWDKTVRIWLTHKGMHNWLSETKSLPRLSETDLMAIGV